LEAKKRVRNARIDCCIHLVLDDFDWEPPTTTQNVTIDGGSIGTALVPIERLVATQALLQAEREDRQRLLDCEQELTERLENLRQQLAGRKGN
jgi:hypothetical protein